MFQDVACESVCLILKKPNFLGGSRKSSNFMKQQVMKVAKPHYEGEVIDRSDEVHDCW